MQCQFKSFDMYKYICRVYTTYDREDGFNVWVKATSDAEAYEMVKEDHWGVVDILIIKRERV